MDLEAKLLFDPAFEQEVGREILPLFGKMRVEPVDFQPGDLPYWEEGTTVITYLDDAALATLVPQAARLGWRLALLPHPNMVQARQGYGIAARLAEAVEDILAAGRDRRVDLFFCNGQPVFNTIIVGEALHLRPAYHLEGWRIRLATFWQRLRAIGRVKPQRYTLRTGRGKTVSTVALGMVVVEHTRNSLLARTVLPDTNINDGMLQALVLAPRCLLEMLWLLLVALFAPNREGGRLPDFIGHIRAETLTVTSPQAIDYLQDGRWLSSREVALEVVPRGLRLLPGRHLSIDEGTAGRESFRVQALPVGEACHALAAKPLPWLRHAATEDFRDLYVTLREKNARPTTSYLVLMILAVLLAAIGLFANSTPVIIGAMILAPMMAPLVSLAMAVVRQDMALMGGSLKTLGLGILLGLAFSAAMGWLMPLKVITPEISARLSPTLLDLGVAVVAGIAGAYAHAREEVARSLAGVAIAVALVPPLAVTGIGLGWGDWEVVWGAHLLFFTNLVGIVLAASLTFLLMGYAPFHLARRGLLITMVVMLLVGIPLGIGFMRMTEEHKILLAVEGLEVAEVAVQGVSVGSREPLKLSVRLVSAGPIDEQGLDAIKAAIEERLGRPALLEATMVIKR
ncbi:DUF389 domain-containing protein [Desulfurivibrio sp. D14AmB]|uniref:DUF389 domain-containing protein n=1 Tax=Desulfurivibrio sp. D14AmB TaxID=3374370 RepID=UPI00376ED278